MGRTPSVSSLLKVSPRIPATLLLPPTSEQPLPHCSPSKVGLCVLSMGRQTKSPQPENTFPGTPPSPHCHSWLWPLAPAADAKNSLVHRETAAPLSGLPDWAWGQSCQDRVVVPGEGGEVHPSSDQGQSTIGLCDLRSPSSLL